MTGNHDIKYVGFWTCSYDGRWCRYMKSIDEDRRRFQAIEINISLPENKVT